jgi:ABC-type phosphate transport system auxiliary subunit
MSDTPRVDAIRRKNYRTVYGEMGQLAEELERKNEQLRGALDNALAEFGLERGELPEDAAHWVVKARAALGDT